MAQLVANQAKMIALQSQRYQFHELVKLLANQANNFLLTINTDGAVRSAIVSCTACKKNGHTSDKCWFCAETKLRDAVKHVAGKTTTVEKTAFVAAQQNSYDAGPDLRRAAFMGNTSKAQKLLSAPDAQTCINYTDADGQTPLLRLPLFQAASKAAHRCPLVGIGVLQVQHALVVLRQLKHSDLQAVEGK